MAEITEGEALQRGWDINNLPAGYTKAGSGGGGGGGSYPVFNFDWTKARSDAFNQLTPYYAQKLELAKGDVELAKKYIEDDYKRGLRYANDTYNANQKYNEAETANTLAQEQISQDTETKNAIGKANERGVYVGQMAPGQTGAAPTSNYFQTNIGTPMTERQRLRTEAIKRALEKQTELAGIQKTKDIGEIEQTREKGLNEQDRAFRNYQLTAGQEQKEKAVANAGQTYTEAYTKFKAANNIGG